MQRLRWQKRHAFILYHTIVEKSAFLFQNLNICISNRTDPNAHKKADNRNWCYTLLKSMLLFHQMVDTISIWPDRPINNNTTDPISVRVLGIDVFSNCHCSSRNRDLFRYISVSLCVFMYISYFVYVYIFSSSLCLSSGLATEFNFGCLFMKLENTVNDLALFLYTALWLKIVLFMLALIVNAKLLAARLFSAAWQQWQQSGNDSLERWALYFNLGCIASNIHNHICCFILYNWKSILSLNYIEILYSS